MVSFQGLLDFSITTFETTILGVEQFLAVADTFPSSWPVNLAFVEDVSLSELLAAMDAMISADLMLRPILFNRRIYCEGELMALLHSIVTTVILTISCSSNPVHWLPHNSIS